MESYEDLVQDIQDGKINLMEFISRQPETAEHWELWLEANKLEKSEETAKAFLDYIDEKMTEEWPEEIVIDPDTAELSWQERGRETEA